MSDKEIVTVFVVALAAFMAGYKVSQVKAAQESARTQYQGTGDGAMAWFQNWGTGGRL